jgi:hypothetical protein
MIKRLERWHVPEGMKLQKLPKQQEDAAKLWGWKNKNRAHLEKDWGNQKGEGAASL